MMRFYLLYTFPGLKEVHVLHNPGKQVIVADSDEGVEALRKKGNDLVRGGIIHDFRIAQEV